MSSESHPLIPNGALQCLLGSESIGAEDVEQDHEEEVESLLASLQDLGVHCRQEPGTTANSATDDVDEDDNSVKKQKLDLNMAKKHLKKASEQVVVANTLQEYQRYWEQFVVFCAEMGFVGEADELETCDHGIPEDVPTWMAVWIMNKADELDIYTGKPKGLTVSRVKYATAQKMRAAISHKFGRDFGFGDQPWTQNPATGKFTGNPSLSVTVSQYMISLQRRKPSS
ncbi:uncharacterized protein B0H18DRAFT_1126275 [Fomitopsis serialis]|uniref:uncharacterized protein n=1 Tax=Fomitopsis serialis TaxID=139415 RepID=UPI002007F32E|nr:uncharacterized protein B0H18DRAFT_1126275 [Neoantrodia serialis]KAH9913412.1 hypothetical protein B0H18DRAFT_1126275 [Neoantrodia serialis]